MYLTQHSEFKAKLLEEVTPYLDKAAEDFVEKLTIDDVDNFSYVRNCW